MLSSAELVMLLRSPLLAGVRRRLSGLQSRLRQSRPADLRGLARRLLHFLAVWPLLLAVHETGHVLAARQQGRVVRQVTVGVGPVLWRGRHNEADLMLRLVPVVGMTKMARMPAASVAKAGPWARWRGEVATFAGGVVATLALATVVALLVGAWEQGTRRRWTWGRFVVADAVVLTVFNFLPVPPLDGGRAVLGAIAAWRGAPLSGDALFWVQLGGLALAVVPMTLWTHWTARIDRVALRWRAPDTPRR